MNDLQSILPISLHSTFFESFTIDAPDYVP